LKAHPQAIDPQMKRAASALTGRRKRRRTSEMLRFSQRKGLTLLQKAIQKDSADAELRNRLWNATCKYVWDHWDDHVGTTSYHYPERPHLSRLALLYWTEFKKLPVDRKPEVYGPISIYSSIREDFLKGEWSDMYDTMEFVLSTIPGEWEARLRTQWNKVLTEENAAYRIIDNHVSDIIEESEIAEVESALHSSIHSSKTHLHRALELMTDKKSPDYRNSIKESILAVEGICRLLTGKNSATLGQALKAMKHLQLHPALEAGFSSIYGYTNDSGGIRHAMLESGSNPSAADAKFMLVGCSAFVNYLVTKAAEPGVKLG
jgi:hypothetical protein